MTIFLIITACLCYAASVWPLATRSRLGPVLSYIGLVLLSVATRNGYPLLPINGTILTGWFCMTLVVSVIIMLQPEPVRRQTRGMGYMIVGAVTGLAIGLLAFSASQNLTMLYSFMILAVIAGIFFGLLLYSRTPDGRPLAIGSQNFFRYLLAKGFPTAITMMQIGVAAVLTIAVY